MRVYARKLALWKWILTDFYYISERRGGWKNTNPSNTSPSNTTPLSEDVETRIPRGMYFGITGIQLFYKKSDTKLMPINWSFDWLKNRINTFIIDCTLGHLVQPVSSPLTWPHNARHVHGCNFCTPISLLLHMNLPSISTVAKSIRRVRKNICTKVFMLIVRTRLFV